MSDEKLLTSAEAARALGVHESTVKRWCNEGFLTPRLTKGGHRRVSFDSLLAAADQAGLDYPLKVFGEERKIVFEVLEEVDRAGSREAVAELCRKGRAGAVDRILALIRERHDPVAFAEFWIRPVHKLLSPLDPFSRSPLEWMAQDLLASGLRALTPEKEPNRPPDLLIGKDPRIPSRVESELVRTFTSTLERTPLLLPTNVDFGDAILLQRHFRIPLVWVWAKGLSELEAKKDLEALGSSAEFPLFALIEGGSTGSPQPGQLPPGALRLSGFRDLAEALRS